MSTKHFEDLAGNYLGAFIDGAVPSMDKYTEIDAPIIDNTAQLSQHLWQTATDYEAQYISNAGFGLVTLGVIAGKPKAIAVHDWLQALWLDYQSRKSDLANASLDFSNNGPMPFTITELMGE